MSKKLIKKIFNDYIKKGKITLKLADGETLAFGQEGREYPLVTLNVHNDAFFNNIINDGNLGLGEAYMHEYFTVEQGSLYEMLDLLQLNEIDKSINSNPKLLLSIGARRLKDAVKGKSHNVRRHYDIGFDIFKYMLDENLAYSCGYQINENDSLNKLQYQKFQRIIDKLRLKDGETLLDIGCGYGSFLIYAALHRNVQGIGVTNSQQHANYANQQIKEKGLADRIKVVCKDYTEVTGSFDKIASIGMLEHVPRKEYKTYFGLIKKLLKSEGSALVHAVGCNAKNNDHDPFIQKYIFPNSNQPKLSEIAHHVEQAEMAIIDVENIVRHYRPTALHWLHNFLENKDKIDNKAYTPEFYRGWEYYLCCCISAARYSDSAVYQVLFNQSHLNEISYERI